MSGCRPPLIAADPEGREVWIEADTWVHVLAGHPEMADHFDDVVLTIEDPDVVEDDPRPGRLRYFRRGGPERWLRVVTQFVGSSDRMVTAFPQANDPDGWES